MNVVPEGSNGPFPTFRASSISRDVVQEKRRCVVRLLRRTLYNGVVHAVSDVQFSATLMVMLQVRLRMGNPRP